jgi:23S rRNA (uracil1939-C5)-methyltransferase
LILRVERLATGGEGVATGADGRVVFVAGGLPGDVVEARVTVERRRWRRAEAVRILAAGPDRRAAPCPARRAGCGGCGWMELAEPAQRHSKAAQVADALTRLGRLTAPPPVLSGPALAPWGFRTALRAAVEPNQGRAGFRRGRSHRVVTVEGCLVAHPLAEEVLVAGRFPGSSEVRIRVGAATGERTVTVDGPHLGVQVPDGVAIGPDAALVEVVAGRRWRVSAGSFFQTRPDGAQLLVDRVAALVAERAGAGDRGGRPLRFVDAYGGVGLLAAAAPPGAAIVSLEANPHASADAAVNLADLDATVVCATVERWLPEAADVVVADPARAGLGAAGVDVLSRTGARTMVLVSCDVAAAARDAGLLSAAGYRLDHCEVLDLFPHTPRVEVVSRFVRSATVA